MLAYLHLDRLAGVLARAVRWTRARALAPVSRLGRLVTPAGAIWALSTQRGQRIAGRVLGTVLQLVETVLTRGTDVLPWTLARLGGPGRWAARAVGNLAASAVLGLEGVTGRVRSVVGPWVSPDQIHVRILNAVAGLVFARELAMLLPAPADSAAGAGTGGRSRPDRTKRGGPGSAGVGRCDGRGCGGGPGRRWCRGRLGPDAGAGRPDRVVGPGHPRGAAARRLRGTSGGRGRAASAVDRPAIGDAAQWPAPTDRGIRSSALTETERGSGGLAIRRGLAAFASQPSGCLSRGLPLRASLDEGTKKSC